MKKSVAIICLLSFEVFGQSIPFRTGENLYFRDADNDTNFVMNDSGELIGGFLQSDLSTSAGTGLFKAVGVISDSVNASVISISIAGSASNIFSNKSASGTALPMAFGIGGSEKMRLTSSDGLLFGITSTDVSGAKIVSNGAVVIANASADAEVLSLSQEAGTSNIFSNKTGSGTAEPLAFGVGGTEHMRLRTDGWLQRLEYKDWDNIAWFAPSDSGAVLDTLNNIIEVLQFYDDTDSVYVTNTWQAPPWFNSLDSLKIWVEAPSSVGDSCAFVLEERHYTTGENARGGFTVVDTAYIDFVTAGSIGDLFEAIFTGFSGIAGDDIIDLKMRRLNTGFTNEANPVPLRRSRKYFK